MSARKDDGGPAFPNAGERDVLYPATGMSLRDWFAGQALITLLETARGDNRGVSFPEYVAKSAHEIADAMLAERAK